MDRIEECGESPWSARLFTDRKRRTWSLPRAALSPEGACRHPFYSRPKIRSGRCLPAEKAVSFHSLQISVKVFREISGLLETIARTTAQSTQNRLREEVYSGNIVLTELGGESVNNMFDPKSDAVYARTEGLLNTTGGASGQDSPEN